MSDQQQEDDLPALYRDIFEIDRRGQRILEDLQMRFGRVSVHTSGGIDAVLKTMKSASQAAVVGHIFNQIDKANGLKAINVDDQGEIDS